MTVSDQEFERWLAERLGGASPEFRSWFLQTYQRLAPRVADPRELAQRLLCGRR